VDDVVTRFFAGWVVVHFFAPPARWPKTAGMAQKVS